jgi:hypothetical protein
MLQVFESFGEHRTSVSREWTHVYKSDIGSEEAIGRHRGAECYPVLILKAEIVHELHSPKKQRMRMKQIRISRKRKCHSTFMYLN